jgi:hypothetical protein
MQMCEKWPIALRSYHMCHIENAASNTTKSYPLHNFVDPVPRGEGFRPGEGLRGTAGFRVGGLQVEIQPLGFEIAENDHAPRWPSKSDSELRSRECILFRIVPETGHHFEHWHAFIREGFDDGALFDLYIFGISSLVERFLPA